MELPLSHLIYCNVVDLSLGGNIHFNIPAAASVCLPSLHSLHLSIIKLAIANDSSVSFPNLKNLHLDCVKYVNEDSVHKLFSSCPVLVDLVIRRCNWDNVLCLIICIPSLTSLRLSFVLQNSHYFACKLHLDTPALQYLDVADDLPCEYLPGENLSCLIQAKVHWCPSHEDDSDYEDDANNEESYISIRKFMGSLSKVESLSVWGETPMVIMNTPANISPAFHNLTRLELKKYVCINMSDMISSLLDSMDNLEHLVIKGWRCYASHQSGWTEPLNVPICMLLRVTTIAFTYVTGDCCDQLDLLRYFLKNAKVLQLLTVNSHLRSKGKRKLLRKISAYPRGSQTCQVEFT